MANPSKITAYSNLSANISLTIVRNIFTVLLGFVTLFVLARELGPEKLGQYNLALFLPQLLTIFTNFGLATSSVYYIGQDRSYLHVSLQTMYVTSASMSVVGSLIGAFIILFLPDVLFPDVPQRFLWIALLSFPVTLIQSYILGIFRGLQDFISYNQSSVIISVSKLFFIFLFVIVIDLSVVGTVYAHVLSQTIGLIIALILLYRRHQIIPAENQLPIKEYGKKAFTYGWKSNMSNIVAFLNYRVDIFLINILIGPTAVGLYFTAVRFVELLWIPSNAAGTVLMPRIAELGSNETSRQKVTPLLARLIVIFSVFVALAFIIGGFFVFRFLGEEYVLAFPAMVILMPGAVLLTHSRVLITDLAARGLPQLNLYTTIITLVIEIIALLIMAPLWGIEGTALASSLAYLSQVFVSLYFYTRVTKLTWWDVVMPNQSDLSAFQRVFKIALSPIKR